MKIGYACIPLTINAKTTKKLTLKSFSEESFLCTVEHNLTNLKKILENNNKHNIKMFRISSDIIPLSSHEINNIPWQNHFESQLKSIGKYIKDNNMRVSMHPGQYTVLNSINEKVVISSIKELQYHGDFLDSLDIDSSHKIILHVGGVYGDKENAVLRFIKNYKKLPNSIKNRLVIENDEKNFSVKDVLFISQEANIPVVFDNLHNECSSEKASSIAHIMTEVKKTWTEKDGQMKVHYSQQNINKKPGAHSYTINTDEFLKYYNLVKGFNPDIMLEVKDKDISAIKCNYIIQELNDIAKKSALYDEWAKYKYAIMERNYKYYKQCSDMVKNQCSLREFYAYIDNILQIEVTLGAFITTTEHVWGYVKNQVNEREKNHFGKLLKDAQNTDKVKNYLKKLCLKYNSEYILKSYYFHY